MSKANLLPVAKIPYKGPRTHIGILKQIQQDCKKEMSYDYIERVVGLFFSRVGLEEEMRKGESFSISGLGYFKITKSEKLRQQRFKALMLKRKKIRNNKYVGKYLKRKREEDSRIKINKVREGNGMPPMSKDDYHSIWAYRYHGKNKSHKEK